MNFTNDDVELVEKFIKLKKLGYYVDGTELTNLYNRVLEKNVHVTSCSSCLRGRVQELEDALRVYKAQKAKEEENNKQKAEENGEKNKGLDNNTSANTKAKTRKKSNPKTTR